MLWKVDHCLLIDGVRIPPQTTPTFNNGHPMTDANYNKEAHKNFQTIQKVPSQSLSQILFIPVYLIKYLGYSYFLYNWEHLNYAEDFRSLASMTYNAKF